MEIEMLVERHLGAWSEADATTRGRVYEAVYDPGVRLLEPTSEGRGHEAVDAAIAGLHAQLPGHVFSLDGAVSHHHDAATYRWRLGPPGGEPVATGSDVLLLHNDRIAAAYVFIDAEPR